jgi:hypothetical protein
MTVRDGPESAILALAPPDILTQACPFFAGLSKVYRGTMG